MTLEYAKFSPASWGLVAALVLAVFAPLWRPRAERYFWVALAAAWGWCARLWRGVHAWCLRLWHGVRAL